MSISSPVIVDVCGTLVRDDTTIGLLRHHYERNRRHHYVRYAAFMLLTVRVSPFRWLFVLSEKISGRYLLKHILIAMLRGDDVNELYISADEYSSELLENRRVKSVWSRLESIVPRDQIVLASASLEPVVRLLAEKLGVGYVSSLLDVQQGLLTGRYFEDITGKKAQAISGKYGSQFLSGTFSIFSDNLTDRSLLEKADSAFVVLHRARDRKKWQGINANFLWVDK